MAADAWREVCRRCGWMGPLGAGGWRCRCGGLFDLQGGGAEVGLPAGVTLGEGHTPLIPAGTGVWVKCDHVMPTGSFKDRGTATMLSQAAWLGVTDVVSDSSGNAGRSVAAYAAAAGMRATVYVPAGTDPARVAAIDAYGAAVVPGGDRAGAAAAAQAAVAGGRGWYASHVYRPAFVHGVKSLAHELWEGPSGVPPATVVVPAGNGTLVMGLWLGFRELGGAMPRIVAVQAERCAPLAGLAPAAAGTAATGIAIPHPPRAGEVLGAVRASRGAVVTVTEEAIAAAGAELAETLGLGVEPSAAAAWAGRPGAGGPSGDRDRGPVVVVLTGAAAP